MKEDRWTDRLIPTEKTGKLLLMFNLKYNVVIQKQKKLKKNTDDNDTKMKTQE